MASRTILLIGPPLSGKGSRLSLLASSLRGTFRRTLVYDHPGPPEVPAHLLITAEVVWKGEGFQLVTLPGALWNDVPWKPHFARADGLVLVLDPQLPECLEADEAAVATCEAYRSERTQAGCVVITKADLVPQESIAKTEALLRSQRIGQWPAFPSSLSNASKALAPLHWMMDELTGLEGKSR